MLSALRYMLPVSLQPYNLVEHSLFFIKILTFLKSYQIEWGVTALIVPPVVSATASVGMLTVVDY